MFFHQSALTLAFAAVMAAASLVFALPADRSLEDATHEDSSFVERSNPDGTPPETVSSPYWGRYIGISTFSCGYPLPWESDDAPLFSDCLQALPMWAAEERFFDRYGRQSQVYGSCVLVWHPESTESSVLGIVLQWAFHHVMDQCTVGETVFYVSNYAFTSWPNVGTTSIYKTGSPPDA